MNTESPIFISPKNWRQENATWRNQRYKMGRDKRALEDSQYVDRPMTKDELIAFAKALMNNEEVYAGFLRLKGRGEFTNKEGRLISEFIGYYGMKNANKLPRYKSGFYSMVGVIRNFASGTYKDWNDPDLLSYLDIIFVNNEHSREAATRSFNNFLKLAKENQENSNG